MTTTLDYANYYALLELIAKDHTLSSQVYFNTPQGIWMAGFYYNKKGNTDGTKTLIGSGNSEHSTIEAVDIAAKNMIELIKGQIYAQR